MGLFTSPVHCKYSFSAILTPILTRGAKVRQVLGLLVTLMSILGWHLLHIQASTVRTVVGFSLSLIVWLPNILVVSLSKTRFWFSCLVFWPHLVPSNSARFHRKAVWRHPEGSTRARAHPLCCPETGPMNVPVTPPLRSFTVWTTIRTIRWEPAYLLFLLNFTLWRFAHQTDLCRIVPVCFSLLQPVNEYSSLLTLRFQRIFPDVRQSIIKWLLLYLYSTVDGCALCKWPRKAFRNKYFKAERDTVHICSVMHEAKALFHVSSTSSNFFQNNEASYADREHFTQQAHRNIPRQS